MKKERATMSDEQRERMLIAEQIERAAAQVDTQDESSGSDKPAVEEGLKRADSEEKVVLSFSLKAPKAPSLEGETKGDTTTTTPSSSGFKLNPLKTSATNPLKRPNVFKMAATSKGSSSKAGTSDSANSNSKKRDAPMSAAEQLMFEEQERKRRKMEREAERR
jgi:DNA/RNA-binding protein KIN17